MMDPETMSDPLSTAEQQVVRTWEHGGYQVTTVAGRDRRAAFTVEQPDRMPRRSYGPELDAVECLNAIDDLTELLALAKSKLAADVQRLDAGRRDIIDAG